MKRILISLLWAACACCALNAEVHYLPHISVGGRAGVSLSQMSFSPGVTQGWLTGTAGAVTFRYSEERIFGIIAEFGWEQRGWKEDFKEANDILNYSRSLTYLRLPVLTHIYFGGRRFKGFVNLGPEVSYMIGDKISSNFDYEHPGDVEGFPANRMVSQMSMDIANKFDYGIVAGLGCEFYVQPRHSVVFEARLYYGLGNIFPAKKADVFSASRSMSIEATVGYNFRLR
ncbi:MAG: PorT family protein [Muribaculaceae bacterium]|nr:PorT family protein [Muribaculaceae bacterium]